MITPASGVLHGEALLGVQRRRGSAGSGGGGVSGFPSIVLAKNPVAAWALGEVSGATGDYSSNGRDLPRRAGTTLGGQPSFVNGLSAAVQIDGSNTGYAQNLTTDYTWLTPQASWEVWLRGNIAAATSATIWNGGSMSLSLGFDTIAGFGSTSLAVAITDAGLVTTTRNVQMLSQPWVTKTVANNSPIYHCVVVYDGLNIYMYMNAAEAAKSVDYPGTLGLLGSASTFGIGRSVTAGRPIRLQGAAQYPFAMTPAQVAENYAAGIAA